MIEVTDNIVVVDLPQDPRVTALSEQFDRDIETLTRVAPHVRPEAAIEICRWYANHLAVIDKERPMTVTEFHFAFTKRFEEMFYRVRALGVS